MCILKLSKVLMYEFYYDYIKNKYGDNSRLLFIDNDSLTYQALTNHARAYVTYSKSKILEFAVLDYFLTSTLTNTLFQFPEYVKELHDLCPSSYDFKSNYSF